MKKNYHPKIELSNTAVKKLKRLFYNTFKANSKCEQDDAADNDGQSTDEEDSEPMLISHADVFDVQLAEKWRYLVSKNDSTTEEIKEFYMQSFGVPTAPRNDPLAYYQKSEQEMLNERKEELSSFYEVIKCATTTFMLVSDTGYKIQTVISVPATFHIHPQDRSDLVQVDIEINIRIWQECRYPYESPLFFVVSNDLNAVQLLNLSFGLQKAADLEWYGTPMIQKVMDWVNGEAAIRKMGDSPSNYCLAAAYDMLEMIKCTKDLTFSVDQPSSDSMERNKLITDADSNTQLHEKFMRKMETKSYKKISNSVQELPIYKIRETLIQNIQENNLVIICGETGSGKSTQIPKFILEHYISSGKGNECNILVTQPRRIAAIGLAQRVSYELCESVGSTVGYAIRLEGKSSPSTQVLYCTTGVLLKKLENSQGPISKLLNEYSHIIIDEVHERSIEIDFILLILKHLISARTDLKVILMSATANVAALAQYFGGNPPIVNVPGRAYLVETLHLEDILSLIPYSPKGEYRSQRSKARARNEDGLGPDDDCVSIEELKNLYPDKSNAVLHSLQKIDQAVIQYPLIINLILYCIEYFQGTRMFKTKAKRIEENRSVSRYRCILVFLPGFQEILDLRSLLLKEEAILNVTNGGRNCLALHSSVSTSDQRRVFEEPDDDHVKIILATNIAETSLTIPDVCIVIDSGKMKEARYDSSKGIVSLEECWISKASGLQRAGRAGRVCAGICLRIYSSKKADKFENEQTPEVHRTPLEQLLLRIKVLPSLWSSSLLDVVKQLIDPPPLNSIRVAMRSLQSLKALTLEESLTPLGMHLGRLPVDIRIGKLLIYGCIFEVLEPILTVAAMMTCKSPFLLSLETKQNDTKKIDFLGGDSDHLTLLNMYDQWMLARQRDSGTQKAFLRENHLSRIVLDMITATRRQLLDYLIDSKFVKAREQNDASKVYDTYLLKAVLVAALYPNIIQSIPDNPERPKKYQLTSMTGEQIKIHPCSVFKNTTKFWPPFILYLEKIKTNDIFIRDVTLVDPIQLVLFGGEVLIDGKKILMESSWIRISCSNAQLLLFLKMELDNLIMQKLKNPIVNLNKNRFFKAIKNIISSNGQKA